MKSYAFYALIDRLRYLERWSLMRSTLRENVAEHSFQVIYIAHALYQIERSQNPDAPPPVDLGRLLTRAIYHDASEVITGDLPTPIKYFNRKMHEAYREIEDLASESLLETLPPELAALYRDSLGLEPAGDPVEEEQIRTWVKAADRLAAYLKCQEEMKLGNDEFSEALVSTRQKILEMDCPEATIFLEHFVPTYDSSLDELKQGFDELVGEMHDA